MYLEAEGLSSHAAAHTFLGGVGGTLMVAALAVAAAAAAAFLLAGALRAAGLHWSWAALAGASAAVSPGSPAARAVFAVATAAAAVIARRGHRASIAAGADLAGPAEMELRPHDLLRGPGRRAARGLRREPARAEARRCELLIGHDRRRRAVRIPFGGRSGHHTLIVGATGSGKTVTQSAIASAAVARGMAAVVIDPKGDGGMRERLAAAARSCGSPLLEWTPEGGCVYNPYSRGGPSEIADRLLAGERFTEPHYLRQAQRYLGHLVRLLRSCGQEVTLARVAVNMAPERLQQLAGSGPAGSSSATIDYLQSLSGAQIAGLSGVRDRLSVLAESDIGPWLDPAARAGPRLDLLDAIRTRAVVYVSLRADSAPLLAKMLAGAILGDLRSTVSQLQGSPAPTLVVIDEFSAVGAVGVLDLFGRARSSGVSLVLASQELSDLRPPGDSRILDGVLGNTSTIIVHRQVVPASAELVARLAGSEGRWLHSSPAPRRTLVPVIAHSDVTGLATGSAAVIVPSRSMARVVRVAAGGAR